MVIVTIWEEDYLNGSDKAFIQRKVIESILNKLNYSEEKNTPVLFIPFLLGERAPFKVDIPHSQFYGLNRLSKRSDIALSVMEGAGFVTKSLLKT